MVEPWQTFSHRLGCCPPHKHKHTHTHYGLFERTVLIAKIQPRSSCCCCYCGTFLPEKAYSSVVRPRPDWCNFNRNAKRRGKLCEFSTKHTEPRPFSEHITLYQVGEESCCCERGRRLILLGSKSLGIWFYDLEHHIPLGSEVNRFVIMNRIEQPEWIRVGEQCLVCCIFWKRGRNIDRKLHLLDYAHFNAPVEAVYMG